VRAHGLSQPGSTQDPVAGSREHGNGPPTSIKRWKFLDNLSDF